eukprot:m.93491 g.93491  ORF g.93491 m.93491 type:complete len:398 (+) comp14701_c0_seq1:119-1312(+)
MQPNNKQPPPVAVFSPKFWYATKNSFLVCLLLGPWLNFVWHHARDIEWRTYWFRVLHITLMATLNSVLAFFEKTFHQHKRKRAAIKRPVFILGHYRSGTSLLHNLISADQKQFFYPSIYASGMFQAYNVLKPVQLQLQALMDNVRPMDAMSMSPTSPHEDEYAYCVVTPFLSPMTSRVFAHKFHETTKYFRLENVEPQEKERFVEVMLDFLGTMAGEAGGRRLVMKSPSHTAKVKLLLQLFPDAQFIYIHRNPYRVFRSTVKLFDTLYWYTRLATPSNEDLLEDIFETYTILFNTYMEERGLIPQGNLMEISFHELQADKIGTVRKIYSTLGWEGFEEHAKHELEKHAQEIKDYKKNDFVTLTDAQRREVNRRWGPAFKAFGYKMIMENGPINIERD